MKTGYEFEIDAHARKRGDQTGLDTLVVHAVNDDNSLLDFHNSVAKRKR